MRESAGSCLTVFLLLDILQGLNVSAEVLVALQMRTLWLAANHVICTEPVRTLVAGLGYWMSGSLEYHLKSPRYASALRGARA
ncbi:hypothetical protein [Streptomyces sp. NPDC002537]